MEQFTRAEAQACISEWAGRDGAVTLTCHAKTQMRERKIGSREVDRLLQFGELRGELIQTDYGEWKCTVASRPRDGRRVIAAVLILRVSGRLLVKTVHWDEQKLT